MQDSKWLFEVCAGGFFFLAGWCWYLNSRISQAIELKSKVDEIYKLLVGNLKEEGMIGQQRRMEKECKIRHNELASVAFLVLSFVFATLAHAYEIGSTSKFVYNILNTSGTHVSGQTVSVSVQKTSTGTWYDFSDHTFKSSGWTSKTSNMTEDSTNGFYYLSFTPPLTETSSERYLFCLSNSSTIYGDHQCATISYETTIDTSAISQIHKDTDGVRDPSEGYTGLEKMIQIHR